VAPVVTALERELARRAEVARKRAERDARGRHQTVVTERWPSGEVKAVEVRCTVTGCGECA
jgi:hypothetical protein